MQLGFAVPDFRPGSRPGMLRELARIVEGLGFGLFAVSNHVAVIPDVAERCPAPFHEPFTPLSWVAGITTRVRRRRGRARTILRASSAVARADTNVHQLSGGWPALGVGVDWAPQKFDGLDVPFTARQAGLRTLRHPAESLARGRARTHCPDSRPGRRQRSGDPARHQVRRRRHPLRGVLLRIRSVPTNHSLPAFTLPLRLAADHHTDQRPPAARGHRHPRTDPRRSRPAAPPWSRHRRARPSPRRPENTHRRHAARQALITVATQWRTPS